MRSLFGKILRTPVVTEPITITEEDPQIELIARQIEMRTRKLIGRSLHIREVDAGSCNGCEIEITALTNPYYDFERFGLHFVASPRHADCLLVTGPVTRNMAEPLRLTYEATPDPKIVIAVGDCAKNCGVFKGSYAVAGSVAEIIPVDVIVPGCPPEPADILRGILTAIDRLPHRDGSGQGK
jgi:Ni,Fe-hydrogenase III small subunit